MKSIVEQFVEYLNSQKKKPSKATVKNYKADILQFIHWFENESKKNFDPALITSQTIELYKSSSTGTSRTLPDVTIPSRQLSPSSLKRHISSLRKFFHFLKIEGIIANNPLEIINNQQSTTNAPDPWHIRDFKNYLYVYNASRLTIKNYVMDVKHFMEWAEQVTNVKKEWDVSKKNVFDKLNLSLIEEYKNRLLGEHFSPLTINRKLSSLRKYLAWAKEEGFIKKETEVSPFTTPMQPNTTRVIRGSTPNPSSTSDSMPSIVPQAMPADRQARYSPAPIETVKQDAPQQEVPVVTSKSYSKIPPLRLGQKILLAGDSIFDFIFIDPLAAVLRGAQYAVWKVRGKPVFEQAQKPVTNPTQVYNIKKGFYAPVSTRDMSMAQKTLYHIKRTRPNWYTRYHSYPFVHYLHFGALVLLVSILGLFVYKNLTTNNPSQFTTSVSGDNTKRTLLFQGQLADSRGNPITTSTSTKFTIYDASGESGKALWTETLTINPNSDGSFSAVLGNKNPLYQETFVKNHTVWLGIAVGNDPELTPRQQLANVALSENSRALDGMLPITQSKAGNKNVVLALDSSGNLTIGGQATSTFQAIGGELILSGNVLTLTTVAGTNSNIVLSPDGLGKVDIQKQIYNSSNSSTTPGAQGAVEIADSLFILASSSAQSAFTINQTDIGPLFSASSSGIAKFTVDGLGNTTIAGDLILAGSRISAGTLTDANFGNSSLEIGAINATGNFSQTGNSTFSTGTGSARLNGDVYIGTSSANTITFNGRVAQDSDLIPATTTGASDLGAANFPWSTLYVKQVKPNGSDGQFGWWTRSGTSLSTANAEDNLSIGGTVGVTGATTLSSTLAVTGTTTLT
ncbi:MAG: site-specific integrase, partial [Candidatus Levyibacteriota bacterium]